MDKPIDSGLTIGKAFKRYFCLVSVTFASNTSRSCDPGSRPHCAVPVMLSPCTVRLPVTLLGCMTRTWLPDTIPCVGPLGFVGVPARRLPVCSEARLRERHLDRSAATPPAWYPSTAHELMATHVPAHFPVTSTVGASVAGPTPPAHPVTTSITRPSIIIENVFNA